MPSHRSKTGLVFKHGASGDSDGNLFTHLRLKPGKNANKANYANSATPPGYDGNLDELSAVNRNTRRFPVLSGGTYKEQRDLWSPHSAESFRTFTDEDKDSESVMEVLLRDDPFFGDGYLLWPRPRGLTERFLQRRANTMQRLNMDSLMNQLFQSLEQISSSSSSSSLSSASSSSSCRHARPYNVSLNTCGFSAEDITVKVRGGKLEVRVATPTNPDADATNPNTTGFVRSVDLPDHVDPSTLACTLGDDGFLRIESKPKEMSEEERLVPIRFRTTLDFPLNKDDPEKND
ncbi:heat shock protein beta-11-like [Trichomycterus rosablanca]|uniref:heat shock protein beta-11-like n=1 Tax=Trichomycterus rosablanca TaxID=2290929 RepID=UPI002F354C2F